LESGVAFGKWGSFWKVGWLLESGVAFGKWGGFWKDLETKDLTNILNQTKIN